MKKHEEQILENLRIMAEQSGGTMFYNYSDDKLKFWGIEVFPGDKIVDKLLIKGAQLTIETFGSPIGVNEIFVENMVNTAKLANVKNFAIKFDEKKSGEATDSFHYFIQTLPELYNGFTNKYMKKH